VCDTQPVFAVHRLFRVVLLRVAFPALRFFTFLLPADLFFGTFDPPDVCFAVTGFIGTAGAGAFGRAGNCPVQSRDTHSRRANSS
jgi:hypothetical protein